MVFSSIIFLFRFLPITLFVYYIGPQKFKNAVLVICSLFFYSWGEVKYFPIMIASILVDYIGSLVIERNREKKGICKICMGISLLFNLGMLFFFKYTNFFVDNINAFAGTHFAGIQLTLPLGISFYTFQMIGWLIDLYRREIRVFPSFFHFGTWASMWPHMSSGPILRWKDTETDLGARRVTASDVEEALRELTIGLAMKVLLANQLSGLWQKVGTIGYESISTPFAWLGLIAFTFQIYFDFYGYSLMAVGL